MFTIKKSFAYCFRFLLLSGALSVSAQDALPWLNDYTDEMVIGKESVRYRFTSVDGNDCKATFEETVTNSKGNTESRSWVFYLSDIDPATLRFNTRGKSIEVSMEIRNSQKFITAYEKGELDEYTDEIVLSMTDVEKARSFIEAMKENIANCKETAVSWEDPEAAFNWLTEHIGNALDGDVKWEQNFSRGEKPYLAVIQSKSVDAKGGEGSFRYLFDLSDMNPLAIQLEASGKSLSVQVPVKEGNRFIEVITPAGKEYVNEVSIYADDIESARQIVDALTFVVSRTEPERNAWGSFNEAIEFVKAQLGEVTVGDEQIQNSLQYDLFASDILDLTVKSTESGGKENEVTYSFYPFDITEKPTLEVSRREITIGLETRNRNDYIRKTSGGSVSGYTSQLKFNAAGIDGARDLIHALEYIIQNSAEELESFSSIEQVNTWMADNLVTLVKEGEKYEQTLSVGADPDHLIEFEKKLTEDNSETTETSYLLYPEDISLDEMKISVRSGKLTVPVSTGKVDYIRNYKNGEQQNFTDKAEVYFFDPLVAKNFMAAMRYLKENASGTDSGEMSRDEAYTYLTGNIPNIEFPEETYDQNIEIREGDPCLLKFTRVETAKDGKSNEYNYEFTASDLAEGNSGISVHGKLLQVSLQTAGNKDLIKPYKNGQVDDFEDKFILYADDVLLAKKILTAFGALSKACEE
jgi:hypothetical protein